LDFTLMKNGIKHIQEMIYMELPTGCQYQSLTNNLKIKKEFVRRIQISNKAIPAP
jgi:hypothetical protein